MASVDHFLSSVDHFLYFTVPCLSSRDIRLALHVLTQFKNREDVETQKAVFQVLHIQRRNFDNYPATLKVLRDFYGKEEKSSEEKSHPAVKVKEALRREEKLKGFTQAEKSGIYKAEKIFKGRIL